MASDPLKTTRSAARALAPFVVAVVLAYAAVLPADSVQWSQYVGSGALAAASGLLAAVGMRGRPGARLGTVPGALVFLAAMAVLRNSVGGSNSGVSALAIIPVFHTALYSRSRRELGVVVAAVGVFYLVPMLVVGPPAYPATQYRAALLSVTAAAIVGFATQRLMASVREQARQSRRRERMLAELTDVVHGLFDSPQLRRDVCRAAQSISDAPTVLLYETGRGERLRCTAASGIDPAAVTADAAPGSAVEEALRSCRPLVVAGGVEQRVGSAALWAAAGRPQTVLFQPLVHDGVALGVLVVGWVGAVAAGDPRAGFIALLAHEAAAAIVRADAMDNLADEAVTDPLTGLPNRRAWDAQLAPAIEARQPIAVAIFDLDRFKQFNDAHGHPAGDRLLKETAAAWRDELRAGDLLARLGGEEFGLLLCGCDIPTAVQVTERLRSRVSGGQTCSAGVAVLRPGDDAETLVARADQALYAAKAKGRDRICVASGDGPVTL